jgi:hypothetical protein
MMLIGSLVGLLNVSLAGWSWRLAVSPPVFSV